MHLNQFVIFIIASDLWKVLIVFLLLGWMYRGSGVALRITIPALKRKYFDDNRSHIWTSGFFQDKDHIDFKVKPISFTMIWMTVIRVICILFFVIISSSWLISISSSFVSSCNTHCFPRNTWFNLIQNIMLSPPFSV